VTRTNFSQVFWILTFFQERLINRFVYAELSA
jgi:hypothetical protein